MYTNDPATNPNRAPLGNKALGSVMTATDVGATEVSKLANGLLASISTIIGADKAATYFHDNSQIMQRFQDEVKKVNPKAELIGRYAGIGVSALLTTPIWGEDLTRGVISGIGGGLTSSLSDVGTEPNLPTSETLKEAGTLGTAIGVLGGGVGNATLKGMAHLGRGAQDTFHHLINRIVQPVARSDEALVEGVDPHRYLPGSDSPFVSNLLYDSIQRPDTPIAVSTSIRG